LAHCIRVELNKAKQDSIQAFAEQYGGYEMSIAKIMDVLFFEFPPFNRHYPLPNIDNIG
jgi:hypothetical protein